MAWSLMVVKHHMYLQLNRGNAHRCIVLTAVLDDGHTVNFSQIPDRNIVETIVNGETV
jgi:hypothetical protein